MEGKILARIINYNNKSFFGKYVAKNLFFQGKTQKQLADEIGITTPMLSYTLNGIFLPSGMLIDKIISALSVSKTELLEELSKDIRQAGLEVVIQNESE